MNQLSSIAIFCALFSTVFSNCSLFNVPKGDSVYERFIPLNKVVNQRSSDEIFRYRFKYNVNNRDYLFHFYMTNATNVEEMTEPKSKYWAARKFS